jgi:hypothetical protein
MVKAPNPKLQIPRPPLPQPSPPVEEREKTTEVHRRNAGSSNVEPVYEPQAGTAFRKLLWRQKRTMLDA